MTRFKSQRANNWSQFSSSHILECVSDSRELYCEFLFFFSEKVAKKTEKGEKKLKGIITNLVQKVNVHILMKLGKCFNIYCFSRCFALIE